MYNPLGGDILGYMRRLDEFGPRRSEQNINNFRIVTGFQGTVPADLDVLKNFKWELSYNYGRNDGDQVNTGNLIKSRLANRPGPSFVNARGAPPCGPPTKPIAGCVPMNILGGAGSIDSSAAGYVTFTGVRNGFSQQQSLLGQAHGRLVTLPNDGD